MPQAGASVSEDDRFVASVPGDAAIEERDDMAVERLPQDETLSEDEIESTLYDPTLDLSSYQRPPVELLEDHSVEVSVTSEEIVENKNRIKETLENFGIRIEKIKATIGPTVTLYEIVPVAGRAHFQDQESGGRHRAEPVGPRYPDHRSDTGQGDDRHRGAEQGQEDRVDVLGHQVGEVSGVEVRHSGRAGQDDSGRDVRDRSGPRCRTCS